MQPLDSKFQGVKRAMFWHTAAQLICVLIWSNVGRGDNLKDSFQVVIGDELKVTTDPSLAMRDSEECVDPDLSLVSKGTTFTLCDGSIGEGTLEPILACQSDGDFNCLVVPGFKSWQKVSIAQKVVSGELVGSIAGERTPERHVPCSKDGEKDCLVVGPQFKAAIATAIVPAVIRAGRTIANVTGIFPSSTARLPGASSTPDLTSNLSNHSSGMVEFWDSAGNRYVGSLNAPGQILPSASDQNFAGSLFLPFSVVGDSNLVPEQIKSGVAVFGVTGAYPSASYPLIGASALVADLSVADFNVQMRSASSFEWFDAYGTRYERMGDADIQSQSIANGLDVFGIVGTEVYTPECTGSGLSGCLSNTTYKSVDSGGLTPWDIRRGKSIAGVSGNLAFYKNTASLSSFNRTFGSGAAAGVDYYDNVEDFNNGGTWPSDVPTGWLGAPTSGWLLDPSQDTGVGGGVAGNGICDGSEICIFLDQHTGIAWGYVHAALVDWETAISGCENLSYGGYTDWRLPSQKDQIQAYINGINHVSGNPGFDLTTDQYWSSTTLSVSVANASSMQYANFGPGFWFKGNGAKYVCVR